MFEATKSSRVREQSQGKKPSKRKIRCRRCGCVITSRRDRIAVAGSHEHTFMNPYGIVFRIGCFRLAAGCVAISGPMSEHTWFSGYSWSCVACGSCFRFLGWRYDSGNDGFFGLILDELREG